jgi:hypothetical protein
MSRYDAVISYTILNRKKRGFSAYNVLYSCISVCVYYIGNKGPRALSLVSRILDAMRLVRYYGLKARLKLRHNWLDTVHLITVF